ncbi:MAG: preprotein translocase subunit SecG [Hyphomicrobiales bacterium]|nr:preprotein translocase subunit SecG [Hyphomicrobiales bacterium]
MQAIVLTIHLLLALALIVLVLVQRSEGGALGIGGGNSMMSGRGVASALARVTAWLAGFFLLTSIGLTILADAGRRDSVLDRARDADGGVRAPYEAPAPILPQPPRAPDAPSPLPVPTP